MHYEIRSGSQLTISNVISIILYCDFSDLSSDFSATFRPLRPSEPLSSIKKRNQKYWWLSRTLRETVQYFGNYREYDQKHRKWKNCGPFYCGLSAVIYLPEFSTRLCSPTSTSVATEVATRFAGDDGIVVLNNNGDYYSQNELDFLIVP